MGGSTSFAWRWGVLVFHEHTARSLTLAWAVVVVGHVAGFESPGPHEGARVPRQIGERRGAGMADS